MARLCPVTRGRRGESTAEQRKRTRLAYANKEVNVRQALLRRAEAGAPSEAIGIRHPGPERYRAGAPSPQRGAAARVLALVRGAAQRPYSGVLLAPCEGPPFS